MISQKISIVLLILMVFIQIGYSQLPDYKNPIIEKRADPWVYKADDGTYYFIATVPE